MAERDEITEESSSDTATPPGDETPENGAAREDVAEPEAGDDPPSDVERALGEARAEAAENYDRFLRAKAELDNVVRRHQRELADRARYEGEALVRDLLPAIDDLERALEHGAESATGGAARAGMADGVEMVLSGLRTALARHGVERIEAEGKPFDPSEHEAVSVTETADAEPNTVLAVFRPGYKIRDRLLRAAMVAVSKPPADRGGES